MYVCNESLFSGQCIVHMPQSKAVNLNSQIGLNLHSGASLKVRKRFSNDAYKILWPHNVVFIKEDNV